MRLQVKLIYLGFKSIGSIFSFEHFSLFSSLDFWSLHLCSSTAVIYLCQAIHITWAFCSVSQILLLSWKQCQLKKWAEHRALQVLSARWMTYNITYRISESKGSWLEASFYPSDWEWKLLQWIHKCVCGGINSSSESPVFLFMSIFNIFDKFHNSTIINVSILWISKVTSRKWNFYITNVSFLKHMKHLS